MCVCVCVFVAWWFFIVWVTRVDDLRLINDVRLVILLPFLRVVY
jgi:hypothetical protein